LKRFLLPLIAALALPTAFNSEVAKYVFLDPETIKNIED